MARAPKGPKAVATLSRRLLQLNASDLVHGSYGIERESILPKEGIVQQIPFDSEHDRHAWSRATGRRSRARCSTPTSWS